MAAVILHVAWDGLRTTDGMTSAWLVGGTPLPSMLTYLPAGRSLP